MHQEAHGELLQGCGSKDLSQGLCLPRLFAVNVVFVTYNFLYAALCSCCLRDRLGG